MSRPARSSLYLNSEEGVLALSSQGKSLRFRLDGVTMTQLVGTERDLVFAIIDLMRAYDEKREKPEAGPV